MLARAEEELRTNVMKLLTAENLMDGVTVETFSGAAAAHRMGTRTDTQAGGRNQRRDRAAEVRGVSITKAFPTRAALSFAEKQGLQVQDYTPSRRPKANTWRLHR